MEAFVDKRLHQEYKKAEEEWFFNHCQEFASKSQERRLRIQKGFPPKE
jgi:hypothetical protein